MNGYQAGKNVDILKKRVDQLEKYIDSTNKRITFLMVQLTRLANVLVIKEPTE